jgi:hypothetical protein
MNNQSIKIEINLNQKLADPIMADNGDEYHTTFEYRVDGDIKLYGADTWRRGKVVWTTTAEWNTARADYAQSLKEAEDEAGRLKYQPDTGILDDESRACDWDTYEVQDEDGNIMPDYAVAIVSKMLA